MHFWSGKSPKTIHKTPLLGLTEPAEEHLGLKSNGCDHGELVDGARIEPIQQTITEIGSKRVVPIDQELSFVVDLSACHRKTQEVGLRRSGTDADHLAT